MEIEVVNQVLHFKHVDGRWVPFSKKQLTARVIRQKEQIRQLEERLEQAVKMIHQHAAGDWPERVKQEQAY